MYFPVFVLSAWITHRRPLSFTHLCQRRRTDERHGIVREMEGDQEMEGIDGITADELRLGESCTGTVAAHTGKRVEQSKEEASGTTPKEVSVASSSS